MNIDNVHALFLEIDISEVIKEGDSVTLESIKTEVERLFAWENDYASAEDYRNQLPSENQNAITNEFETVYRQFQTIIDLRRRDITSLASNLDGYKASIKNLYKTIYQIFVQDYRGWLIESEGNGFTDRLEEIMRRAEINIESRIKEGQQRTEQTSGEVAEKIVGAELTKEWAQEYTHYIVQDEDVRRRLSALKRQRNESLKKKANRWVNFFTIGRSSMLYHIKKQWIAKIEGAAFYNGDSYLNLSNRWRFWRSLSYFLLLFIAIYYLVHAFIVGVPVKGELISFFWQKLTFLPLVTVLAIGLMFSSKNFRINLNLLEEYRHRYVVAKTIQNLLLLPENGRLRNDLLTKGTNVLFEHRPSGYMDKDAELSLLEKLTLNPELPGINFKRPN